ncbi:MAG TPA: 5-formyltetrahydrofolate cyclo-ligase [Burkholderiales bacterium]|nr:5-formyltetrahydrofolate cyclo-ligase [Burkholderiales bacterium]
MEPESSSESTGGGAQFPAGTLRDDKRKLRTRLLSLRAAVDSAERARLSRLITERLLNMPEFERAGCVLAYLSFGSEFDTNEFVRALLGRGCVLVLPRIDLARRALTLHRVSDPESETVPGVWGIREPDPQRCPGVERTDINAVLVPGVAFTAAGGRLGYGGGFYDRLLRGLPGRVPLVGPAFELQVVEDLPLGPDDEPIDTVVTEAQVYRRAGR